LSTELKSHPAMVTDKEAQRMLAEHRRIWQRKPTLRRIYREEFFDRLISSCRQHGVSVEVGAGPGFLKEMLPRLISTDVVWCPWLDVVTDAQHMPFKSSCISNVMGLDILHHLEKPMEFLQEAERVLVPGGRVILVEPWITPFSYLVYRYLHQEDCELSARPLEGDAIRWVKEKKAFDGNQAIPYLLFGRGAMKGTLAVLSRLKAVTIEPFCLFAYLLSFGFKPISLLPEAFYPLVSLLERMTLPLWRSAAALRVLLVLEKSQCQ
jgi:SAM-dependent methyltransferase